jgi:acetolactate synthase-1/2/3 large subunit
VQTIAEKIAEFLEAKGITHAFGIIGGGNFVLWDAIVRRGFTEVVCVHHEQAAVMAASYFYRTSGVLAAVLCTTGAGSTNAITGVEAAYMDRIPVLILSGNEASKYMYAPTIVWGIQGYDSSGVAENFTKRAIRLKDPRELEEMARIALTPPMGPVWVDIPKDVQGEVV